MVARRSLWTCTEPRCAGHTVRRPVPPDSIMRKGFLQNNCPTACTEPRCAGHAVQRPVPPDGIMRKGVLQNDCPTACTEPRCAGPAMRRPVPPDGIMQKGFLQNDCILAIIRFTYFVPIKKRDPTVSSYKTIGSLCLSLRWPVAARQFIFSRAHPALVAIPWNIAVHTCGRPRSWPGFPAMRSKRNLRGRTIAASHPQGASCPRRNHLEHRRAHLHPSSIMARVPGDEVEAQPPGPNDRHIPSPGRSQPISP